MSDFDDLPTLDAASRTKRRNRKGATRLEAKIAAKADTRRLDAGFRAAVWRRDGGKCRVCGVTVKRTLELDPRRGEVHHLTKRYHKAVIFDRRNGLLVCCQDHHRLTIGTIQIVRAAAFTFELDGRTYLNADHPLSFSEHPEI